MIKPPVRIGMASKTSHEVMNSAQVGSGMRNQVMPGALMLITVVM